GPHGRLGPFDGHEVDFVDLARAVTVDEIQVRAADPLDSRDVQLHRSYGPLHFRGATLECELQRLAGIPYAKRHRIRRRAVGRTKLRGRTARLHVEYEVD